MYSYFPSRANNKKSEEMKDNEKKEGKRPMRILKKKK